jgi:V/A-type H+-transporting ATPase subunit D
MRVVLTRLGLKREREKLARYERFLPALKLRQQQLQLVLQRTVTTLNAAEERRATARAAFDTYREVLGDLAGVDVVALAEADVKLGSENVAGVRMPTLERVTFREGHYSLFGTPPWVDRALMDLRQLNRHQAEVDVLEERRRLLQHELNRVVQRVNLFEKVKIPEARAAIHKIRIHLGDEMAAAVGRSKIAKARLAAHAAVGSGEASP